MQRQRAANPRMIALMSALALAVGLPIAAATAGPASSGDSNADAKADAKADANTKAGSGDSASGENSAVRPDKTSGASGIIGLLPRLGLPDATGLSGSRATCGPELSSPEGVEAQTCVLTDRNQTWARTYYRNATGEPLHGVLTLMRSDGRTVQVHCPVGAEDEPATCETPREPLAKEAGRLSSYGAIAEIASADKERLLLRSGSNST